MSKFTYITSTQVEIVNDVLSSALMGLPFKVPQETSLRVDPAGPYEVKQAKGPEKWINIQVQHDAKLSAGKLRLLRTATQAAHFALAIQLARGGYKSIHD
jgi:hypothetical protein